MNKNDLMIIMMAKKTLDYQKDPNPENWVTISGAKVHLDEGGKIDGGAKGKFNGKSYSGTKKQAHAGKSDAGKQTEEKPVAKKETKTPEVGDKGMAFLKRMSVIHSSFDESTGYMARDIAQQLKDGKSLEEIKDYFYGNIEKWGSNKEQERKEVDHFIEAVKRADKGLDPWNKGEAKEPKLGAPKMAESKSDFPLKEKNDDFYKKQAQATMRHWLIQKHMENTTKNKREIADEVRHDVEFWAEQWKRNYEIAKTDSRYTEKEVASLKEKAEGAQKELEWFNKLWPKKESKKSAPKSAGKEDDVKQVEISFPGGYKGHFSQVPGEKDVIFDWDKMERMEIPGGLEAFLKKAREKGIEVNENYTPEERKLEEYPPSRQDRRLARMGKLQSRASKHGRPPGSR